LYGGKGCGLWTVDCGVEALPSSARDVAISAEIDRGRVIHVMSTTHVRLLCRAPPVTGAIS
jgi:hypothetical protein